MKHLNPINEYAKIISGRSNGASDEKIISDNIFYFDNPDIKDIIDYATASIGDKTENFTINHGWISVNDYENPGFEYSQHTVSYSS